MTRYMNAKHEQIPIIMPYEVNLNSQSVYEIRRWELRASEQIFSLRVNEKLKEIVWIK